uniref:ANK_REP_REGION domain-containing protein n=1 Tax=Macrostomum lignano TaxID=282301 RepID=A0A1I8FVU1_9PLAT
MHQDGEAALTEIVKKVDSDCLTTPDEDKITPLHLSARYHSDKSWQQNFELTQRTNNELRFSLSRFKDSNGDTDIESYMFAEEDVDGNTAAHFAARNENSGYRHFRKISKMRTDSSANHWLKCMNKKDETVLHLAALHGSPSLASKLIQLASENPKTLREWYELKDKQGNTFLHALARSEGKDSVLLEALNLKAASPNQKQPKRQELIASLEQNMPENAPQPQENQENQAKAQHEKSRSVASTASQGRQPDNSDVSRVLLCQNKRKSTVLHYAVENCERETIEKLLKAMKTLAGILICCDKAGNTVFHIAAKRTDKTEVLKLLLKSLRLTTVEQVAPIMRKRNNKNRSVFHFAIDAMDPSDSDDSTPNDPPLSQEDQLSQEWTIKRLITSKAISKEELQRTDRAGNTLLHSLMQSQLTYDGFEQDILDRFKLLQEKKKQKTDRMVLIRSLEMDSRRIFRAALSLDIVTRETEPDFTEYFIATLRIDGNIRRAFQQQNIFKHMDHVDDTFELALLDLAAFFHRDEILPDLILTRQFELIPCCLSLLIRLGPEIIKMRAKAEGKHEQLLQLQKKVTNIAVNALNELFENADRTELELLNKYIKGEITNCYSSHDRSIGPMISMLWNLIIFDLLPFLMILFVIFGCFGVFFTCLLFSFAWAPEAHDGNPYYRWQVFIQAATLPFNLLFNNFDQLEFSSSPDSTTLGKVAIKQGHEWFYYLLIFIFLGLVNVVMMNMLIALFNLRVTQMYGVAIGIWRKRSFEMLQEYQEMSLFPPPFSFLVYFFFNFPTFVYSKCCNRKKNKVIADSNSNNGSGNMNEDDMNDKTKRWWLDKKSYPADYTRFLAFQATQFRRCRSRLLRDTQWNRNDFDVVKAHTGNELADFKLEVQEMLDNLKQHGKHEHESAHKSADKSDDLENLKQRIDDIDKKLEQLLALVRPDRAVEVRGQLSPPTMDSGQQQ